MQLTASPTIGDPTVEQMAILEAKAGRPAQLRDRRPGDRCRLDPARPARLTRLTPLADAPIRARTQLADLGPGVLLANTALWRPRHVSPGPALARARAAARWRAVNR